MCTPSCRMPIIYRFVPSGTEYFLPTPWECLGALTQIDYDESSGVETG